MRRIIQFGFSLILICLFHTQINAQCSGVSFTKSVNSVGQLNLDPLEFYDGPADYQSIALSQTEFGCDDVGSNPLITLTVVDVNGSTSTCDFTLSITDQVGPVAICEVNVVLQLDANGEATLTPDMIDEGSYDNCGIFQLDISQTNFSCADVGSPVNITLAILDIHGNVNSCLTSVIVEPFPNPIETLSCNANVFVSLDNTGMAIVTPDMILAGGPYKCEDAYTVTLEFNGTVIPENTLNTSHAGQTIQATITDTETNNTCWGLVVVSGDPSCESSFYICDTECRSAPFGDCASGHTDADNVEWPCDLTLDYCDVGSNIFTLSNLLLAGFDSADVNPTILNDSCGLVAWSYEDTYFTLPNGGRVDRK